jgi:hypothetical protein
MATWESICETLEREFACDHAGTRLVLRLTSDEKKQYLRQCLRCGKGVTSSLPHSSLTLQDMLNAPPFDAALLQDWINRRGERKDELYQAAVAEEKDDWQRRYDAYLLTPQWRAKSKAVIARDVICQACLSRPAVQAHHKDYRHVGNEPLFDLVGVCLECHRKLHDPDAIASALRKNFEQSGIYAS